MKHMIELVHRDIKRFNNYVLYFQDGRGKHEHAQVKHQRFFFKKKQQQIELTELKKMSERKTFWMTVTAG